MPRQKHAKVSLSDESLRQYPGSQTEDDLIDQIEARDHVRRIFELPYLGDREKAILALRHEGVLPGALRAIRVQTPQGPKSFGELASSIPSTGIVSRSDIGQALGIHRETTLQHEKYAAEAARKVVKNPEIKVRRSAK